MEFYQPPWILLQIIIDIIIVVSTIIIINIITCGFISGLLGGQSNSWMLLRCRNPMLARLLCHRELSWR